MRPGRRNRRQPARRRRATPGLPANRAAAATRRRRPDERESHPARPHGAARRPTCPRRCACGPYTAIQRAIRRRTDPDRRRKGAYHPGTWLRSARAPSSRRSGVRGHFRRRRRRGGNVARPVSRVRDKSGGSSRAESAPEATPGKARCAPKASKARPTPNRKTTTRPLPASRSRQDNSAVRRRRCSRRRAYSYAGGDVFCSRYLPRCEWHNFS